MTDETRRSPAETVSHEMRALLEIQAVCMKKFGKPDEEHAALNDIFRIVNFATFAHRKCCAAANRISTEQRFHPMTTLVSENRCPKCGDLPTYQTPDGTYWDGNAHFWRLPSPSVTERDGGAAPLTAYQRPEDL
jgi:hypothetical protein